MSASNSQKACGKILREVGIKSVNLILLLVLLFSNTAGAAQARPASLEPPRAGQESASGRAESGLEAGSTRSQAPGSALD